MVRAILLAKRPALLAVLALVCVVAALRTPPAGAAVYSEDDLRNDRQAMYFDAHNHITGVLPFYAYANLPAFIARTSDSSAVGFDDRLALYRYLSDVWYPAHATVLGDRLFSPPDGQRFSLGARAALVVYRDRVAGSLVDLDGALERVLTATPWSEFDSAYAFRGGPAGDYLKSRFYGGEGARLSADLCKATVLDLAATHIEISEQSLPFIGGWGFRDGHSERLDTIECIVNSAQDASVGAALRTMNAPMPIVKFVLMTHTSQLATLSSGTQYSEWSKTGRCEPVTLPAGLRTSPSTIYNALLAEDDGGRPIVAAPRRAAFFDAVVGIDTAGPETTCFTPDGMNYYLQLVEAVYEAAKARRQAGWHGKLLVHTHVGEGSVIDYAPVPPAQPWTFGKAFATLPSTLTNSAQAQLNITALLAAVSQFEQTHPDAPNYVVFRLAHDTWANEAQAAAMHDEGIEADVNLESNVATGAYPISRMPIGSAAIMRDDVDPLLGNEPANFALNNLLGVLVKDPNDELQVGTVLGNASLRYLLEKRVRCLLGTDADGVEHSDIVKEYEYASALIAYWNRNDPAFRALAPSPTERTLFENVRWHMTNMSTDAALPYDGAP
ncbi:MAG: hypothetical protein ABI231_05005 [Candidatus Tumulicola sp.]